MTLDVTFGMALLAGIISFLSPCVLPLVPPYLCFITGASLEQLSESDGAMAAQRRRTLLAALFFVLGFSTVFILMGVSASYVGQLLRAWLPVLAQVAGVFIILMGLNFLGVFKLGFLSREKRYHAETRPAGLMGAYGVGLAFAFGWTPCIGPVLAMILTLAATEQNMAQGAGLLAVYSAGLGIPFLLAAAGIGTFLGFFRRFRSQMRNVERAMGLLLVLTGVMFLNGYMQAFSYWLIEQFPWLATIG
jgi:cytochrome c-type biogenesis protein